MSDDVQRSLGNIEGTQTRILDMIERLEERIDDRLKRFEDRFGDHVNADQLSFSSLRAVISDQRKSLSDEFAKQATDRNERLDAQDKVLADVSRYIEWAKGASWPIIGVLGLLGAVVVAVVVAAILSWLKIKA